MSIFSIALTFFLVANPIGNTPAIVSLVRDFEFQRQRVILFREAIFALFIAIFFLFGGVTFLSYLQIKDFAVTFAGGLILFITALRMIFPAIKNSSPKAKVQEEPFIVPIATPLLSGAGLLTIIMLYSKQEPNHLILFSAILIAWIGVIAVLSLAPYLQKLIGRKGLTALEQLMGMVLAMISVETMTKGLRIFSHTLGAS